MPLKTFDTLEQAIRELRRQIKPQYPTNVANGNPDRGIYPARYDHSAINNIADQISTKKLSLTDQQQILAIKLITKYRKQWKKRGFDVSNIDQQTPVEFPIRRGIDRSFVASAEGNVVTLKFPYKPRLIAVLCEFRTRSCGKIHWNPDTKLWYFAATADNVKWIDKFIDDHKFKTDRLYSDLHDMFDHAYDYKSIQLDIADDKLVLHDAPATMLAWIEDNIGSIDMSNFVRIAAIHELLEFTLSEKVIKYVVDHHADVCPFIMNKRMFINSDKVELSEVLDIVKQLQFNNITIFCTGAPEVQDYVYTVQKVFPGYDVVPVLDGAMKALVINTGNKKRVTITNKILSHHTDLIISMAGFMASSGRKQWFNSATKNIYWCSDIDTKLKKSIIKREFIPITDEMYNNN